MGTRDNLCTTLVANGNSALEQSDTDQMLDQAHMEFMYVLTNLSVV